MKKVLFALSAVVLLASCSKDDDNSNQPITPTEANLQGNYKLQSLTVNGQDVMAFMDACEKDDVFSLKANDMFDYVDAGTVCSPAGDYSSTWNLISSTQIDIDGEVGTIKSWNGSVLVVEDNTSGMNSVITLKKQ